MVLIGQGNKVFTQRVIYGQCPRYCSFCKHLGHDDKDCLVNGTKKKPEWKMDGKRNMDLREIPDKKRGKQPVQEVEETNTNEAGPSRRNEDVIAPIALDFAVKIKFAALVEDATESEEVQDDGRDK